MALTTGSYTDSSSPMDTTVTQDPWGYSAAGQQFASDIVGYFGGQDPFAQGQLHALNRRGTADYWTSGGALAGVDPHFIYDLMQVLGGSKDGQGNPLPFDATDVTRLGQQLWADTDLRNQYHVFGNSVITSRLKAELSQNGTIGKRGAKSKYGSVAEEFAAMNPMAQQSYLRQQADDARADAIQAEADFKRAHASAYQLYQQYYGRDPSHPEADAVMAAGPDIQQQNDFIRTLPSHVAGINVGAYFDLRQLADKQSQVIYGHDSNDQIVKEMFDRKLTAKDGVQFYYDQMPLQPGKNIEPIAYNLLYKSAAEHTQAIWNQNPSPLDLATVWAKNGSPGAIPATAAAQSSTPPTPPQPGAGEPNPQPAKQQAAGQQAA